MTNFLNWLRSLFKRSPSLEDVLLKHEGPVVVISPKRNLYAELYATAKAEMGVQEIPGTRDNPRIVEYHSSTSLSADDDETFWCASFVCWVVEKCGFKSNNSARARDWLNWGVKLKTPVRGCIVVFSRGAAGGHVAFFHSEDGANILVLGGNQGNKVSIAAYPKSRLLGYRGFA